MIDSIMGSGKTTNLINEINESSSEQRYFCVMPLLEEGSRIIRNCPKKKFFEPNNDEFPSKTEALLCAIERRENIVTTHSLFCEPFFTEKTLQKIRDANYKLVIDETFETVRIEEISKSDMQILIHSELIKINEDDTVEWLDKQYKGKYNNFKREVQHHRIVQFQNILLWLFPIELIMAFPEVEILTFLFECSQMSRYFNIHGLTYEYCHIENGCRISGLADSQEYKEEIGKLLHIYEGKLNHDNKQKMTRFSSTWYQKASSEVVEQILNDAYNFLHNRQHACFSNSMWTIFLKVLKKRGKSSEEQFTIKSFKKSYCSCNARAINSFGNAQHIAYLINYYCNPLIKDWFSNHNAPMSDDRFALYQMLQWIWRSAIRNQRDIYIYIPSCRMREILCDWIYGKYDVAYNKKHYDESCSREIIPCNV